MGVNKSQRSGHGKSADFFLKKKRRRRKEHGAAMLAGPQNSMDLMANQNLFFIKKGVVKFCVSAPSLRYPQ